MIKTQISQMEQRPLAELFLIKQCLQISRFLDAVNALNLLLKIFLLHRTILSCIEAERRVKQDFQCKWSEFSHAAPQCIVWVPNISGKNAIFSHAARHLTTKSNFKAYEACQRRWLRLDLDIQKNTVLPRKTPQEDDASWRSETIILAKLLSLVDDNFI